MFFIITLTHTVQLHPQHFSSKLRSHLESQLYSEVEGKVDGRYGQIISVISLDEISEGKIAPNGYAEFDIIYKALVLKFFTGMVVEGIVTSVNKLGFNALVGNVDEVFVAKEKIPSYYRFDSTLNPPAFVASGDQADVVPPVQPGSKVRIRVIGVRVTATMMVATGTISEDYLGPQIDEN